MSCVLSSPDPRQAFPGPQPEVAKSAKTRDGFALGKQSEGDQPEVAATLRALERKPVAANACQRTATVERPMPSDQGWAAHPWSAFRLEATRVRRYLTLMITRISSKGQIVLPAAVRQQDDIQPGQQFEVERVDRGEYRLRRCEPSPNQGLADWLLSCPEKGFFVEVDSESTDDL